MLRDWRALICFGSKGEGCEEATGVGVGVGVRVRGVGEEVGAEAGGRVLVGLVVPEEVTVVMVAVVRRKKRNGRGGLMVLREKVECVTVSFVRSEQVRRRIRFSDLRIQVTVCASIYGLVLGPYYDSARACLMSFILIMQGVITSLCDPAPQL